MRTSGFLSFCQQVEPTGAKALKEVPGRTSRDSQLCHKWKGLSYKERDKLVNTLSLLDGFVVD